MKSSMATPRSSSRPPPRRRWRRCPPLPRTPCRPSWPCSTPRWRRSTRAPPTRCNRTRRHRFIRSMSIPPNRPMVAILLTKQTRRQRFKPGRRRRSSTKPTSRPTIRSRRSTPSLEDALDLDLDVELDPDVATARDASGTGAALEAEATHAAAGSEAAAELPLIAPPAMSATTIKDDATSALDRADDAAVSPDHAADAGRYPGDDDFDAELAGKSDAEIAAELVALSQADTLSEPSFDAILELAAELTIEAPAETEAQDGRREPTLGEPPSEHLVAAALDDGHHDDLDATREDDAAAAAEADAYDTDAEAESGADQVDDDVQVSAVGLTRASPAPPENGQGRAHRDGRRLGRAAGGAAGARHRHLPQPARGRTAATETAAGVGLRGARLQGRAADPDR